MTTDNQHVRTLWAMAHLGTPMAIRVAATLRLADHLAAGLRTVPALADACGADHDGLARLLSYLTARGVFARDGNGHYSLNELGQTLLDAHPAGLRTGLDIDGIGRADLAFVQLRHSVLTGQPGYARQFGAPFWDDLAAEPARAQAFNTYMSSDMPQRSADIAAAFDWGAVGHLVDVGGGNGALLIALLHAHPRLRGTVLDLPTTAPTAQAALTAAQLADRGDVVVGSFFEPLPAGAGGYLLSLILHDWDDESATAILQRCADAAGTQGSVFVVEAIGGDGASPHTGMDLRMLVLYGGRERGVAQLVTLAARCGLGLVAVHPAGELAIVQLAAARADGDRRAASMPD